MCGNVAQPCFDSLFIFLTCLLFSAEFFVLFLKQGSRCQHLRKRNELSRSKSLEEITLEKLLNQQNLKLAYF